jgi:uncharacterized protein (DUF1697 family)
MKTWIAFLRGINVGGNSILPMKELVPLLEAAGCRDVKTYIQSGNVVLRHTMGETARVAARIRQAISKERGFEPHVLVLEPGELEKAVAANPFSGAAAEPRTLHLYFLDQRPRSPDIEALNGVKAKSESFALKGRIFYLHAPDGFGASKLAQRAERFLGVNATARNWHTVTTVLELARSYQS